MSYKSDHERRRILSIKSLIWDATVRVSLFSSPRNHQFEQLETKHKTFLLKLNKVVVINRAAAVCGDKLILAFIVEFVAHMKIIF